MKKLFLILTVLFFVSCTSSKDFENGKKQLENMGYTDIENTGYNAFCCSDDDPLRILRAIRFSITKGFRLSSDIYFAIHAYDYDEKMSVVSGERIREELIKCFKHNTHKTMHELNRFHKLKDYVFTKTKLWLKPTFEE